MWISEGHYKEKLYRARNSIHMVRKTFLGHITKRQLFISQCTKRLVSKNTRLIRFLFLTLCSVLKSLPHLIVPLPEKEVKWESNTCRSQCMNKQRHDTHYIVCMNVDALLYSCKLAFQLRQTVAPSHSRLQLPFLGINIPPCKWILSFKIALLHSPAAIMYLQQHFRNAANTFTARNVRLAVLDYELLGM